VGNVVGSNIFNLLGVLGLGAVVAPGGIAVAEHVLWFDLPVMVFVALVTLPVFYIDNRISRLEGGLLLSYYVLYMAYLVLQATANPALIDLQWFAVLFVPGTFCALLVAAFRTSRNRRV
jgi:cation:H+ antiporter